MESRTEPRVTPGYLVLGAVRPSVIEARWANRLAGLDSVRNQRCVVGGIQQAAAQLMSSPKHAFIPTTDVPTGIPLSAQRRT